MELATEYRIRRADDGIVRTIARRGEFERNPSGRPIRMLGVVQDVTEQRLARAAVAESEARFRAFAEAVPNQVWSAAPDGRLDWANQRTFDFDGQDLERLMANGWEQQVHPDDLHQAVDAWARAIDTGEPYVTEFRLCRADGEYRWHIARAIALFDDEGRVAALETLNFHYRIEGDRPIWRPLRAFDDGRQTMVEFAPAIASAELPPLWVLGTKGDAELVNYRVQGRYLVVDRLFDTAEMRLGAKRQQRVRIIRESKR